MMSSIASPRPLVEGPDCFRRSEVVVFDFAVVDEAQDLGVSHLRFFAALGGDRPNGRSVGCGDRTGPGGGCCRWPCRQGAGPARREGRTRRDHGAEQSVLYRVVAGAWARMRERLELRERPLPRFCVREVEAYLRCGILAHGFARVWCEACGKDDVVAFSCKGRGFCLSCGARRMADTAAWLCDRVLPAEAPVRQWVLSLPYRLRVLCAYDADDLAGGEDARAVRVDQQRQHHARRVGLPALAFRSATREQRVDVQFLDRVDHEPREVVLRKPVTRRRWQQQPLSPILLLAKRAHAASTLRQRLLGFC